MQTKISRSSEMIRVRFDSDDDDTSLFRVIKQKGVLLKPIPGIIWEPAAIIINGRELTLADFLAFQAELAEVVAEAERLDREYPPGMPVETQEATPS